MTDFCSAIPRFFFIPTNKNLTVLQQLYLIGNHSHGFGVGINFNGIECLIHRYSCYASLNYIFRTDTSFYIHCQSFTQSLFIRYKRDAFHLTVLRTQLLKYGIDNRGRFQNNRQRKPEQKATRYEKVFLDSIECCTKREKTENPCKLRIYGFCKQKSHLVKR